MLLIKSLHDALSGHSSLNLEESIKFSEHSLTKCIGITIETRPDYCLKRHLSDMLLYGCTRLEIGVQSIYEGWIPYYYWLKLIRNKVIYCRNPNGLMNLIKRETIDLEKLAVQKEPSSIN